VFLCLLIGANIEIIAEKLTMIIRFFFLFFFFNFAGALYRKQMSKNDKIIERFKSLPKDFTFEEMEKLLSLFGYEKSNKGKTS